MNLSHGVFQVLRGERLKDFQSSPRKMRLAAGKPSLKKVIFNKPHQASTNNCCFEILPKTFNICFCIYPRRIVPRQHCFSMVHKTIGCRMRSIHHISCQMLHCVTEMSTELFVLSNFVIVFIISTTKVITSIIRRCTVPLVKHTFNGKLVTFA